MRRQRLYRGLRAAGALALALAACAWIVGRLLTDRYPWSQPVSWIPPAALAAPLWAAALVVLLGRIRRRDRRAERPARPARSRIARGAVVVFSMLSLAHLAFIELGLHRLPGDLFASKAAGLRLVFWNQAGQPAEGIAQRFLAHDPTLLVLANRHADTGTREIAQAFLDSGSAHTALGWPFDLFSRLPITRWGSTSLGLDGQSRMLDGSPRPDPGWAAWFEVQTDAGPLTVWAIDLPSDPRAAKYPLAQRAGRAIAAWEGAIRIFEEGGQRFERSESPGFPPPDVVVGDFNIPRGSASLRGFFREAGAPPMRNAFDAAGVGWQRTWPREWPVWAIDQCFVREGLGVRVHSTFDPGVGGHRALAVEISPR